MNSVRASRDPDGEDALLLRVQQGDLDAFEPIVDQHLAHIRAFLALRAPAAHLVDEVAHETFVFAFRNIRDFVPGTSLAGWLRAIAWNLLRAEIQRFSREQVNQARYAETFRLEPEPALEQRSGRELDSLRECLEQLPPPLRELLSRKYEAEQSSEGIARELKRSTAWVWTTLFRVRQQLKTCLQGKLGKKQPC